MNANDFIRNSNAYPAEELLRYAEQYVAWSMDGKAILAHAPELEQLYAEVDRRGLSEYVVGFVPGGDFVDLGGAGL